MGSRTPCGGRRKKRRDGINCLRRAPPVTSARIFGNRDMTQRRALVAGNWKMNGSRAQATALVNRIARDARALADVELVLCPPFVLIPLVAELLRASGARIACGGQ